MQAALPLDKTFNTHTCIWKSKWWLMMLCVTAALACSLGGVVVVVVGAHSDWLCILLCVYIYPRWQVGMHQGWEVRNPTRLSRRAHAHTHLHLDGDLHTPHTDCWAPLALSARRPPGLPAPDALLSHAASSAVTRKRRCRKTTGLNV